MKNDEEYIPHQMAAEIFSVSNAYRLENVILREMLRGTGLSDVEIQRRVKSRMKRLKIEENAALSMAQACREILKRLDDTDPVLRLARTEIKGHAQ